MGSFAEVIHYLKIYLRMHPDDTAVMFTLAALHMRDGHLDQARALLLQVVRLAPENKDAVDLLEEVEHALTHKASRPTVTNAPFEFAHRAVTKASG